VSLLKSTSRHVLPADDKRVGGGDGPRLQLSGLRKAFGDTQALAGVDLQAVGGEIHAVVGENGSGKSTLVKLIAGVQRADAGTIVVDGTTMERTSPARMMHAGVSVCFQEVLTVGSASVLENVFLGYDGMWRRRLSTQTKLERCAVMLERLCGRAIDPLGPVETLSLSERQWITVARALVREPRILILDESTAALDLADAARLLAELELLKEQGTCVLLVTHRLTELRRIADRATVLRDGASVGTLMREEMAEQHIVELMTGESLKALHRPRTRRLRSPHPVMRAEAVELASDAPPISVEVAAGEILGLAGLEGEGHVSFLRALAGVDRVHGGRVQALRDGAPQAIAGERDADAQGVVYVPGDRKTEGILPHASILENFSLPSYRAHRRARLISRRAMRRELAERVAPLKLKAGASSDPIGTLSGGNQQKVIIARWLERDPRIILLNDPTRGVDIVTKRDLYDCLRDLADEGTAIVFLSTEIEELVGLCDRILVFRKLGVAEELDGDASTQDIVAAMFGVERIHDVDEAVGEAMQRAASELGGDQALAR
jgi:ABC-type sugar transport system ATPase subunit